jgi:mannose-1-phosphate guanylyltransferase / mannose-6-phosphate isomerase
MPEALSHLHIVVLCGTSELSLWPIARAEEPQELASAPGRRSLLAETIERYRSYTSAPFLFVVQEGLEDLFEEHLIENTLLDFGGYDILTVPGRRGSAFSLALAAVHLKLRDPGSVMLVTPANQHIVADERLDIALRRAYEFVVETDRLTLLALTPTSTAGSRSYVKTGVEVKGHPGIRGVRSFVSSPSPVQALRLADMGALWSSDIYLVRATTTLALLHEVDEHANSPLCKGAARIAETAGFLTALGCRHWANDAARQVVATLPDVSFAACVIENTERIAVVPTSFELRARCSLTDEDAELEADRRGNRHTGRALTLNARNTTVCAEDRLVVALGTDDLMVVDTKDALLVAQKNALTSLPEVARLLEDIEAPELRRHIRG